MAARAEPREDTDPSRTRNRLLFPPCLILRPVGFAKPERSPVLLVSSYLTVSPLPRQRGWQGGLLSVALSLASRPVGVTHHRALRRPDFPPANAQGRHANLHVQLAGGHPVHAKPFGIILFSVQFINRPAASGCPDEFHADRIRRRPLDARHLCSGTIGGLEGIAMGRRQRSDR